MDWNFLRLKDFGRISEWFVLISEGEKDAPRVAFSNVRGNRTKVR